MYHYVNYVLSIIQTVTADPQGRYISIYLSIYLLLNKQSQLPHGPKYIIYIYIYIYI